MNYINGRLVSGGSINDIQYQIDVLNQMKQDLLESGINIKTINGESIVGEGDLAITGTGVAVEDIIAASTVGGIVRGKEYLAGTPLETIIRDLLSATPQAELSIITGDGSFDEDYFTIETETTIAGTRGMAWLEFIDSLYNHGPHGSMTILGEDQIAYADKVVCIVNDEDILEPVNPFDYIQIGAVYKLKDFEENIEVGE